jgi:cytochrome c-type biogenesis protein CcmF
MVVITRRNTRRYGGYLVHFGVVLDSSSASPALPSIRTKSRRWASATRCKSPYTLVCQSYTQDDKPNYSSEWAVIDVYKGGKRSTPCIPERRFYKASEQTSTIVANRSRPNGDLYLVYTGRNQDTGRPIIKAHLNPLVMWIWIGVVVVVIGTLIALIPNAPAPVRVPAPARLEIRPHAAPVVTGD